MSAAPPDRGRRLDPQTVPGFLTPEEGHALAAWAEASGHLGPIVEIGSYCGRSTLYLAEGARRAGALVVAIDHHRGSEEHQPGEAWHDPAMWDPAAQAMDTLGAFRATVRAGALEDVVVPMLAAADTAARVGPLAAGMVFIDGGHSFAAAMSDWRVWATRVTPGGVLAIHDVLPDPRDGGRPPTEVYARAVASGLFDPMERVGSLAVLMRIE